MNNTKEWKTKILITVQAYHLIKLSSNLKEITILMVLVDFVSSME